MDTAPLFRPFTCRGLTIENRIVMAPMTRSFSPDGVPGEDVAAYYERRAANDVGLIISEGTTTDRPGASNDPRVPNFHEPAALAGWERVINQVHAAGGKMGPQIWHTGMMRKPGSGPIPEASSDSPSGVTHKGKQIMDPPSQEEIADMAASFARAAVSAKNLGFDMIELHGAHGYLIDEFFWDVMNQRDDKYGGSLIDRSEFAAEIVRLCREAVGDEIPISLRISQWKQQDFEARLADTPKELEKFVAVFADAGVDLLHCSQRRFWESEFDGSDLNFAGWVKKLSGVPTISVGSVGLNSDFITSFVGQGAEVSDISGLLERMDREEFDLIAVGRALLHDPLWAQKVKQGRMDELSAYDGNALATLF